MARGRKPLPPIISAYGLAWRRYRGISELAHIVGADGRDYQIHLQSFTVFIKNQDNKVAYSSDRAGHKFSSFQEAEKHAKALLEGYDPTPDVQAYEAQREAIQAQRKEVYEQESRRRGEEFKKRVEATGITLKQFVDFYNEIEYGDDVALSDIMLVVDDE